MRFRGLPTKQGEPLRCVHEGAEGRMVPYRDGALVHAVDAVADPVMYAEYGVDATVSVEIGGMDVLLEAVAGSAGTLLLGLRKDRWVLAEEDVSTGREWLELPDEVQPRSAGDLAPGRRPHLIRTTHRAAFAVGAVMWWLAGGKWMRHGMPGVPRGYYHFGNGMTVPGIHLLDGGVLYGGWDMGQWKGTLAYLDMERKGAGWTELGGRERGDTGGIPGDYGVNSIFPGAGGDVWVGTGCGNLGCDGRGIHQRNSGGEWTTWMDGDGTWDRGPLEFPERTTLLAMAMGPLGEPHIIADTGAYLICDGRLEQVFRTERVCLAKDPVNADPVLWGCVSMVVTGRGDILTMTEWSGMFGYRETGGKWTERHIACGRSTLPLLPRIGLPGGQGGAKDA